MVTISRIKKDKKQYVVEFLKDDHVFLHSFYEEVIIAFRLFSIKEVEDALIDAMKQENDYYKAHYYALDKLKKRLTEHELTSLLVKQETALKHITKVVAFLRKHKLINDSLYAADYVKMHCHDKGPNNIRKRLLDKGVSQGLVNDALAMYNETIEREVIDKQLQKYKNMTIKLTRSKLKEKWVRSLLQKGHTNALVFERVEMEIKGLTFTNQRDILEKDMDKTLRKLGEKPLREKKEKVLRALLMKGHAYEDIVSMLNEKGCLDETEERFE